MKLDLDLHRNSRKLDSYNKPFNFVMSAREPGKTTEFIVRRIYKGRRKDKRPWIYLTRQANDITEELLNDIEGQLNKFIDEYPEDEKIIIECPKSKLESGIVDVKIKGEIFLRFVALNVKMRKIKQSNLQRVNNVFMDEYIINPELDEKYIKKEAFKIKEAYTTRRRENPNIKFYFAGNPYSLFNPLFMDWGVDLKKLHKGDFYIGDNFVIEWALITPALRKKLLEENPLYKFDEDYKGYALEGDPINDKNIKLGNLPLNFSLKFVFRIANKYLGIFKNNSYDLTLDRFFVSELENVSKYRNIICFEFNELIEGVKLFNSEDKLNLSIFKSSIGQRKVVFNDINCYYLIEEIYKYI